MNKCPLCGFDDKQLIYTNSRDNKYLENYVCDNCGFIYVLPRHTNERVDALYKNGEFSKEARKLERPDFTKYKQTEAWALERIHILEQKQPDFFLSSKTCLEIGSGTGSFLWLLKNRGHKVFGIEPDSNFSKSAKERYGIDVKPVLLEEFETNRLFDFVATFHVIEHIVNPNDFIKNINSRMKSGGLLYIECPTIDDIYTNDLNTFFWDVHVNTFSNTTLPYIIECHGFEVIEVFMHRRFVAALAKKSKNTKKTYSPDSKERIVEIIKNATSPTQKSVKSRIKREMKKGIKLALQRLHF